MILGRDSAQLLLKVSMTGLYLGDSLEMAGYSAVKLV